MGLLFLGENYKGKQKKPIHSSDGKNWYEDVEQKNPIKMEDYQVTSKVDGSSVITILGFILIGIFIVLLFH